MFRQPLIARTAIVLVQQPIYRRFQQSGSHRQTVRRHFLAFITVAQQQGLLQQSSPVWETAPPPPLLARSSLYSAGLGVSGRFDGWPVPACCSSAVRHAPTKRCSPHPEAVSVARCRDPAGCCTPLPVRSPPPTAIVNARPPANRFHPPS